MKTQVTELEPNKVALAVEVGKDKVAAAYSSFYQRAARSVKVPGFRPGKAPPAIIAKFLGPEAVRSQIQEELLQEMIPLAVKEARLEPVSQYLVEEVHLREGEPFTFKAVFEVKPKLGDLAYTGHHVHVPQVIVDDESLQSVLQQLREQFSKTAPLESGELQVGDYFLANIQASIDGQPEPELTEEKGYHKLVEDNRKLAPLKGMKIGESRSYQYTFDHETEKDSKFFGKTVQFQVKLERISRPMMPDLTDEFAKEVGDYPNLEALKAKIRNDLETRSRAAAEERAFEAILDKVAEKLDVKIPEAMIQRTIDFFMQRIDRRWRQFGTNLEEYLKKANKGIREFRESFRERASHETKLLLILDAIAAREKIEVSDADFRAEIEQRAKDYHVPVEKLLSSVKGSETENELRHTIRNRKIREFLLKNNDVHYDMVKEADLNKGDASGDAGSDRH
ncbi:MAG: Cell division trigger factor [Candidatus Ozemobacter sibiricus]|uniref:Trigger factor n=1 Tax=Candidatus Ozemobacter sibiricus TaxID=2268124 RepID=A0A367ZU00_9BACT|nr:MAG: Cell division trigger factor [Candidatus Ozemobacter sibiricus]